MRLAVLKTLVKCLPATTHLGFITLLSMLLFMSISVLGYVNSLYGLYEELVLGPTGEGLVVSSYAVSPLTSLVSEVRVRSLLHNVSGVSVEFIVLTPAYTMGRVVVVRGLERDVLLGLTGVELLNDPCVIVGEGLASELHLKEDDVLPLYSPFTRETVLCIICYVIRLPSLLNHEVVTSLGVARTLRGIGSDYYSVAVLRASNLSSLNTLAERIGLSREEGSLIRRALLILAQQGSGFNPTVYRDIPEAYMARLGFHKDLISTLAYSIATVVLVSNPLIGECLVRALRSSLEVFRSLGLSRGSLITLLLLIAFMYGIVALATVLIISEHLRGLVVLRVLNYVVQPKIGLEDVSVVFSSEMTLLTLGIVWGFRKHAM
ncbi:MAG: hypothetical protein QXS42_06890 [Zestosphaera sp.]